MPAITARGAVGINSIDGGGESTGLFDLSTPAGWHFSFWVLSVAVILFFLWAL